MHLVGLFPESTKLWTQTRRLLLPDWAGKKVKVNDEGKTLQIRINRLKFMQIGEMICCKSMQMI